MSTVTGKLTRSAVTGRVPSVGSMICTPSARRDLDDEIVLPESFIEPLATDGTFSLELDDTDDNWWWTLTEDVPRGRTRYVAVDGDSTYSDLEDVDPSSGVVVPPLPPVWRSYIDAAISTVTGLVTAVAGRVTTVEGTLAGRLSDASLTTKIGNAIQVVSDALAALAARVTTVEGTLGGRLSDLSIAAKQRQLLPDGITYNTDGTAATSTLGGITTTYTYNTDGTVATEARDGQTKTYIYAAGVLTGSTVA